VSQNGKRLLALLIPSLVAAACGPAEGDIDATATFIASVIQSDQVASATATPAFMPVTIRLEADGSGDYASLEEAVRNAPHQATIRLGTGTYNLSRRLNVRRSLRLVGAGMDETEIVSTAEGYAIRFTGDGPFGASDLTISHVGGSAGDVVVVRGGEISFERCRLSGAIAAYEYEDRAGLWILGETTGRVRDCTIERNDTMGIYVTGTAHPTLEGNRVTDNSVVGIGYCCSSGGTAQGNQVSGSEVGIGLTGEAAPTLEGNTCSSNASAGILYTNAAAGTARQNECTENEVGIGVWNESQPMLEANNCNDNSTSGIVYAADAGGTAGANQCLRNQMGIVVGDRARPTLEGNTCNENGLVGISFSDSGGGIASNNICAYNGRYGISIEVTSNPTIMGNDCHDNGWSDIEHF
jgi:parallel beta-helix repeat protein